jgi:hypothetical protein
VRGLPTKAAKLWAAGGGEEAVVLWLCEGAHGAVDVTSKKCEDCQIKQPTFGLPAEGKSRWCWL